MTDHAEKLKQIKRAVLLQRLQQDRGLARREPDGAPLRPVRREGPPPLSFAQQRLWFLDQFDPGASRAYHIPYALRLQGRLDRGALQATFDRVLARHESLRTHFAMVDGEPVQIIEPADVGFALDTLDLRTLPDVQRAEEWVRLGVAEAQRRFDLSQGPLIRGRLLQLDEQDHVLLLTQHHIVSDGWSIGLLVQEVSALYAAFSQGRPDPLPALPLQYADYALWQRQWLQGEVRQRQEQFWKAQLQGAPERLDLPTDRPRPALPSFAAACTPLELSADLGAGLRRLGQQHGCTLFMVLLAGWVALLARWSRQNDLVIGAPVANRRRSELEPLVGFFVNMLALRLRLDDGVRVTDLLEQVKATTLEAYAHQDLPFEQIVEMLQPTRSLSHSAIVQVGLSLDNTPGGELALPELTLRAMAPAPTTTQFDLYAELSDEGGRITGSLIHARDLFDAATIERLAQHYVILLAGMVADPAQPVHTLPWLSDAQRRQVLASGTDSAPHLARQDPVHQLFEARAADQPGTTALVYHDGSLSYEQLNRRANQLAHQLLQQGVRRDDRVGICVERGFAMVVGMLGVLKAGAAFVPLDPRHPAERLAGMLQDSAPVALISQPGLQDRVAVCRAPVLWLDAGGCLETANAADSADATTPDSNIDPSSLGLAPHHLAYVIYTSGSTGQPNGVMVEHRGLTHLALAQIEAFGIRPDSRVLQFASFSFDACVSEVMITLCHGATLHLAAQDELMPGDPLLQVLREHRITCVTLPPVALAALPTQAGLEALDCLIVAGEACAPELAERWSPGRRFINAYGPTEATVCATTYLYEAKPHTVLPIGRPLGHVAVYILDAHRQPVPPGVTGEIFIGGIGVARGYLNRPELSAERFSADPFRGDPLARMYKTGDLGRWRPDGHIDYLGRNDMQLKLRGLRIEPGEIESCLRRHPRIDDAVVLAREDRPGDRRLVAYLRQRSPVELWPSVSEFYVYDDLLYQAMAGHQSRNRCYADAFARHLAGRTVVEIGPGPHAVLARMAIEAGASKVYAIELLERSYHLARACIRELGLEDRIVLIHGDATQMELPEPVDYCISEIVGNIGGSEGSAVIINSARRFLKNPAQMIPARSQTRICAVALAESQFDYAFSDTAAHYVEQIFEQAGGPFDLRLCVKGLPDTSILSTAADFEDLDYTAPLAPEARHAIALQITRAGTLSGFMLWMVLHVDAHNVLDTHGDPGSWLPVYVPVFDEGVAVAEGDCISATIVRWLGDGLHPDFRVEGRVQHADGRSLPFSRALPHQSREYRGSAFYQRLFATDTVPVQAGASPQSLRAHLLKTLPDYMVPSAFVTLAAFPLTPNGKLDRRALPAPDTQAVVTRGHEAPQGDIEQAIAALWQTLLHLPRVGRHDHFFELGGHSLLAVQLLARLRQQLGVDLPLRDLFMHPSLEALSRHVAQAHQVVLPPIKPAGRGRPLPLSFAQQRLWFLEKLGHAADAAYYMPAALRLCGPLDAAALRASLDAIVARHEVLRTTFAWVDGEAAQVIAPPHCGFTLTTTDLRAVPDLERPATALRLSHEEAQARFDLAAGPLIRGQLLQLAADEHLLLVTQHHIISDGWSIGLLVQELSALYAAFSRGLPDPLPALPIQYADYALWQRQWLQGALLQAQLGYWKSALQGAPALLELPTDRPRPAMQSFVGSTVPVVLSRELSAQLRRLSQQHGTTLFMTLLAGWSVLLARLSRQDDVVIGVPVANRQRVEIEGLIGLFVNTLALRVRLQAEPSVSALLEQVKHTTLAAYAHQDLPFEQVVDAVQPPRTLSHSPVFQAGMGLDNVPSHELVLPGLQLSLLAQPQTTTQFDLFLSLSDDGDRIGGQIEYAQALFDAATIARWAEHLQTLLAAMAGDAAQPVHTLALLTPAQRHQLLHGFNATAQPHPHPHSAGQTVPALFAQQAAAHPEATALVCEDESLSYGELNRRANRIAHHLIALGVRPDDRVAICTERSLAMVAGLLGILKAGAAYVPLDPAYPAERLAAMLADSAPQALLTQPGLRDRLPPIDRPVLWLQPDGCSNALHDLDEHDPDLAALGLGERHLAYVIYTSGSTGQSKGVMIEHRSVVNFWRVMGQTTHRHCPEHATVALNAAFSFDMSLKGILQLLSGHTLVLVPQWVRSSGEGSLDFLARHRVHAFDTTPSQLEALIAAGLLEHRSYAPVSVLVGGEAIKPALWAQLAQSPVTRFYNMYGPTECTVDATIGLIAPGHEGPDIGRAIANTQVYLLDAHGQPVPLGAVGELHVGGLGVARGYWRREALSAERFVRDPFSTDPQARLYKTGDLGRYLADGRLQYVGRNDFQIKVRGFRIEPGEIEARLRACTGVRDAVVLAREDRPGDQRLVAYVVPQGGTDLSAAALREPLAAVLPDYMVPAAFVVVEAFPLTPNGKLDRRALPAPGAQSLATRGYEPPQGEVEVAIAQIWQGLLGVAPVGRHDRFFDLGGHSLLAVQVLARLRKALSVKIGLRELFAAPTVAALARCVMAATRAPLPPIEPADRSRPLPLSFAQQRLWFLDQLDPAAGAAYHMPAALRLRGPLRREVLRAALDRIVARHEVLRTRLVSADGIPAQVIGPREGGFALAAHDLQSLPAAEQAAAVQRLSLAEAQARFDLSSGPLIRGQLLQLAAHEHILLVTQHHIISDGWSIGLLVRELSTLYSAFSAGQADPLPALPIQYADYAAWQHQWLQGEELQAQLGFWKTTLQGAPALLELPTDRPRPAVQSYAGATVPVQLPAALSAGLRQISQQHGCTLFMTLLAGWAALLSRLSGQDDVAIGTPVANRPRTEVEPLIGFFANTLALRVPVDPAAGAAALLQQVKHITLAAYGHQDLPFEQVVEALQPRRSLSHSPIFQVMLNLNNTPGVPLDLPGLALSPLPQPPTTAQFDLALSLVDDGDAVLGELLYASDLFDRATVQRLLAQWQGLLAGLVADAGQDIGAWCASLPARPVPATGAAQATPARPAYEAPRGRHEPAIAALWADLLECGPVGRHDDFFALGGVSLMAVRMLSQLRKSFGLQATLHDLFSHPTPAALAGVFDAGALPRPPSCLVPVRPTGGQRPLYLVHPVGGHVQYALALAHGLDADIPVYGLAATGFAAGETPVSTLPEMAARYIEAIRSVQATGPYRLAGWSAGGLIAYEMARQLSENGDAVEFVGLLDTAPDPWRHRPAEGWTEANYLRSWLPAALPDGLQQQFDRLAAAHDLGALMALATTHDLLPPGVPRGIDADELRRCLGVAFATQQALFGYRPLPIDLPVSLFVAAAEVRDDSTAAWQALLGRHLGVVPVPGTHMSMVEPPHAADLAGRLSDALAATALLRPAPTPGLAEVH